MAAPGLVVVSTPVAGVAVQMSQVGGCYSDLATAKHTAPGAGDCIPVAVAACRGHVREETWASDRPGSRNFLRVGLGADGSRNLPSFARPTDF